MDEDVDIEKLNDFIKQKVNQEDVVFIIPGAGCPGCISEVERFLIKNKEHSNGKILYVLTRIDDKKTLRNRLNLSKDSIPSYIIFDNEALFSKIGYESIYPMVLFLDDDKKIIQIEYKSPENADLMERLQKMLTI